MRSIIVTTIEDYIIKAQFKKAFEYMKETAKELLKSQVLYNDLLKLQSRFTKLKDQSLKNTIDNNTYMVELSKINESLIDYKNQIEKIISDKDSNDDLSNPELELLIYANAYAFTIKDIEMVSKTIHSEIRDEMIAACNQIFSSNLDLTYEIKSIEIIEMTEEFATASVIQTTSKKDPTKLFRDNEIKINHTFAKENKRWKIFSSLTQEIKYF